MVSVSRLVGRLAGVRPELISGQPGGPAAGRAPEGVVIGGGVAVPAAAVVLAERGVPVVICEAGRRLGGRLGTDRHTLPDGTSQPVDHGFHGFFRQYYNWRRILRRIAPETTLLNPLGSYPVVSARWPDQEFGRPAPTPPVSLLALTYRSPSLRLRDLARSNLGFGLNLLR